MFRVYGLESVHWLHQGHRPERVTTCWLWSSGQDPPVPSGRKRIRKWISQRSHTHWNEENIPPWCEEEINLDNISKRTIKKWIWTRSESHSLKWLRRTWHPVVKRKWVWTISHYNMFRMERKYIHQDKIPRYRREGKEEGKESGQDLFLNEMIREDITIAFQRRPQGIQ